MPHLRVAHAVGWRFMLALGLITIAYSLWALFYLTTNPFSYERAFGVTHDQVGTFNHGMSTWIDLQLSLKVVYVSLILTIGVLIALVSYHSYRKAEKWSWFALLIAPLFPLLAGILTLNEKFLQGIYGVAAIDVPLKVVISTLIPLYILGLVLSAPFMLGGLGEKS